MICIQPESVEANIEREMEMRKRQKEEQKQNTAVV